MELVAKAPEQVALVLAPAHGHGVAEGDDGVAVDPRHGGIPVDQRGQDRQRVALVREVHRDARASFGRLPGEPRRRDDDVELGLELGEDLRHQIGGVGARERPLERQPLEELARGRHLPERPQSIAASSDPARDDLGDRRVALEPQAKPPRGGVAHRGTRQHPLAGDRRGRTFEGHLGVDCEGLEELAHAGAEDALARRRSEDAVDAHVCMGRREPGEGVTSRSIGCERLPQPLVASVGVDDDASHGQQAVLAPQPVDEPRGRGRPWRPGQRLSLLGGLGEGDDRGRDVHARVDLRVAIARPLARRDVQGDGRGDDVAGSTDAERELALARGRERDRVLAGELHPLRPGAG